VKPLRRNLNKNIKNALSVIQAALAAGIVGGATNS